MQKFLYIVAASCDIPSLQQNSGDDAEPIDTQKSHFIILKPQRVEGRNGPPFVRCRICFGKPVIGND
jgi:hypothetical protein